MTDLPQKGETMIIEEPASKLEHFAAMADKVESALSTLRKWRYTSMPCIFETDGTKIPLIFGCEHCDGEKNYFVIKDKEKTTFDKAEYLAFYLHDFILQQNYPSYYAKMPVLDRTETWNIPPKDMLPFILDNYAAKAGMNKNIIGYLKSDGSKQLKDYLLRTDFGQISTKQVLKTYMDDVMGGIKTYTLTNIHGEHSTVQVPPEMIAWLNDSYLPTCNARQLHTVVCWKDSNNSQTIWLGNIIDIKEEMECQSESAQNMG